MEENAWNCTTERITSLQFNVDPTFGAYAGRKHIILFVKSKNHFCSGHGSQNTWPPLTEMTQPTKRKCPINGTCRQNNTRVNDDVSQSRNDLCDVCQLSADDVTYGSASHVMGGLCLFGFDGRSESRFASSYLETVPLILR